MSLRVDRISKAIGGLRILRSVSMTVPSHGLVGLIGPNGAGKSTAFAVASGFMRSDSGEVWFDDRPLNALPPQARARLGLVRTFQVPRPFGNLTVRENLAVAAPAEAGERLRCVYFGRRRFRREEEAVCARADEIVRFLNLTAVADSPTRQLSGGQRKLVEIGRVLMTDPKMILLDEPFAGVNPVLFAEISERILELNARGVGFLIVEHNLQALARMVRHLYVMDRGSILAEGRPNEVLSDSRVREAYIGGVA
jgi:branched-chain amino acid transport system ATP-binding protein